VIPADDVDVIVLPRLTQAAVQWRGCDAKKAADGGDAVFCACLFASVETGIALQANGDIDFRICPCRIKLENRRRYGSYQVEKLPQ